MSQRAFGLAGTIAVGTGIVDRTRIIVIACPRHRRVQTLTKCSRTAVIGARVAVVAVQSRPGRINPASVRCKITDFHSVAAIQVVAFRIGIAPASAGGDAGLAAGFLAGGTSAANERVANFPGQQAADRLPQTAAVTARIVAGAKIIITAGFIIRNVAAA